MVLNLPEQDAGDLLDGIANKPEELEDDTCSHETAQAMHKAVNMVLDVMEAEKTGKKQDVILQRSPRSNNLYQKVPRLSCGGRVCYICAGR